MLSATMLNGLGLMFGLIGALVIFRFGIPPQVRPDGASFLRLEADDQEQIAKAKRYRFLGNAGVGLLVASFALQLAALVLTSLTS